MHLILFESRITIIVLVILGLTDLYNRDIIILFSFLIGRCSIENPLEQPGATTCKERSSVNFLAHSKHFKQKSKNGLKDSNCQMFGTLFPNTLLLYNQYGESFAVLPARRYPLNVCSPT